MRPRKGSKWVQGVFKPLNPKKYVGDSTNIVYRSSWELRVFSRLDTDPDVVAWSSEELIIPYRDPVTKRDRRYFPDLVVRKKDGTVEIWEIKPSSQQEMLRKGRKSQKRFLEEAATYMLNQAKWEAARVFCKRKGWAFRVLNEHDLGISRTTKRDRR